MMYGTSDKGTGYNPDPAPFGVYPFATGPAPSFRLAPVHLPLDCVLNFGRAGRLHEDQRVNTTSIWNALDVDCPAASSLSEPLGLLVLRAPPSASSSSVPTSSSVSS